MKKRKILALILACMTVLSLVACGNEPETNNTADTTVTEDAPMDPVKEKENWTDMVVTIKYINVVGQESFETYPLNNMSVYNVFGDLFDFAGDIPIPSKGTINKTRYREIGDEYYIYSNLEYTAYNPSETDGFENLMISKIKAMFDTECTEKYGLKFFILPANITFGSTMAEVEGAYGEPTSTEVTSDAHTTYIYADGDKHLELYFGAMDTVEGFNYYIDLGTEYTTVE